MIKINLLPDHLRPIQRTPLPYIISFALSAAAIAGIGMMFVAQRTQISSLNEELASEKAALAALQDIVTEANQLAEKKLSLQSRILTIQDILSDRIVWSEQLHQLATLTPENIWYRGLTVVYETFPEEQVEYDPKTNEPIKDPRTGKIKMKRTRIKKPVLQVSGYVINDEQGRREVYPLMQSTGADEKFMKNFTLQQPQFEDTEFNGYPVRDFTLPYLISAGEPG